MYFRALTPLLCGREHTVKKTTLAEVLFAACICLNAPGWASDPGWASSVAEAMRLGKAGNRPIMIEFTSPACGPCKKMEVEVFGLPAVKAELAKFVKVKADITQPDMKALSKKHGFSAVPAFVFMRPNGTKVVSRQDLSPALPQDFLRCVQSVLTRERAVASARKMVDASPDNPRFTYRLGVAYSDVGEHELAREQFEKLLAAKPYLTGKELADANFRLAKLCEAQGEGQKASTLFDAAIQSDPQNKYKLGAAAAIGRGRLALADGDFRTAYKCFDRVIKKMNAGKERNAEALYFLGLCYKRMGNTQAAAYTWKRGAQMYPRTKYGLKCASAN